MTVPSLVLSPPDRYLGLGQSGPITGAAMTAMLANPGQWSGLLAYKPLMQVADEHLAVHGDTLLQTWFSQMKELGLLFGVETTPISKNSTVAATSFARSQHYWKNISKNGGTLSQVALNDPLAIGLSLGMTRAEAIAEISQFITLVQEAYPAAVVGFNAVYPKMLSAQQIDDLNALQAQLKADGSRGLDFYRVDFAWYIMENNPAKNGSFADLKIVSDHCDSIGLPFSLLCAATDYYAAAVKKTGQPASPADDVFYAEGLASLAQMLAALNWNPKQVDLQDFTGAPSLAIPETNPNTYTGSGLAFLKAINH